MGRHVVVLRSASFRILREQQDSSGRETRSPDLTIESSRAFSDELLVDPIDHLTRNSLSPCAADDRHTSFTLPLQDDLKRRMPRDEARRI